MHAVVVSTDTAAALQELELADLDCTRLIFQIRCSGTELILAATAEDLDELLGSLAAEANHETQRRRRSRLDTAITELDHARQHLPT